MEVFAVIGIIWVLFVLAKIVLTYMGTKIQHEELKVKLAEKIRVIRLEPLDDQNIILAFDAENGQFLCQGQTNEEIKTTVVSRYPEKVFILGEEVLSGIANLKVSTDAITNAS